VRWSLSVGDERVRTVVKNWLPVVFGAGVLQISSIIDTVLGSLVGPGAVASLGYAQLIAILPVSLFGVSVAAAALPELSRDATSKTAPALRARVADGTQRVVYFILPSAVAMAVFGRHLVAPLFQTGEFGPTETAIVTSIVAVYGIAVPAQATVRLLTSGHYALGDTKTPVRIAIVSVVVSATSAFLLMRLYGVVGIAMGAAIAAYLNAALNYRALAKRTEGILRTSDVRSAAVSVTAVLAATALAYGVETLVAPTGIWGEALLTLGVFGVTYLGLTFVAGHPVARAMRRG
jgi:putative peptidoglycan lipid II flippase